MHFERSDYVSSEELVLCRANPETAIHRHPPVDERTSKIPSKTTDQHQYHHDNHRLLILRKILEAATPSHQSVTGVPTVSDFLLSAVHRPNIIDSTRKHPWQTRQRQRQDRVAASSSYCSVRLLLERYGHHAQRRVVPRKLPRAKAKSAPVITSLAFCQQRLSGKQGADNRR